jgi:WD40 repeat protein
VFLALAVSPNEKMVATATEQNLVRIWDVSNGTVVDLEKGELHGDLIRCVTFHPNASFLASSSHDTKVKVWDLRKGECVQTFEEHKGRVCAVAYSPKGDKLVSADDSGEIWVWDPLTDARRSLGSHDKGSVFCLAFSREGLLASGGGNMFSSGEVRLWRNWESARPTCEETIRASDIVFCVAFSPDGKVLAYTDDFIAGEVVLLDLSRKSSSQRLRGHSMIVSSFAFHRDGKRLVTGSADGSIKFWQWELRDRSIRAQELARLEVNEQIRQVAFLGEGESLVSASTEGWIRHWRAGGDPDR